MKVKSEAAGIYGLARGLGVRGAVLLCASVAVALFLSSETAFAYPTDRDPGFGTDGVVMTDFSSFDDPQDDEAVDVMVDTGGKIVAAGYAKKAADANPDFALSRYNPEGLPEASFGYAGKAAPDLFDNASVNAAALTSDDGVVVVGSG